jgi:ribosomal RNA-processing protein 12|tara:strand:+ start:4362 stop:8798 length:4437 start_codon:yes stop_codon:yes gene_type:complete
MNRRAWTRRESSRVVARTDSPIKTLARAPPRAPRERRRIERATSIAAIRRHARATPFARAPTLDALDALDAMASSDDDDARPTADARDARATPEGALERLRRAHGRSASASSARVVRACDAVERAIAEGDMRVNATSVFAAAFGALERASARAGTDGSEDALEALEAVCACAAEAAADVDGRVIRAKMERTIEVVMGCGRVVSERSPKSMRHVARLLASCAAAAATTKGESGGETSEKHGKRAFQATLNLSIDGRPKVRKAAVHALGDVVRRVRGDAARAAAYGEMTAAFARKIGEAPERAAAEMQKARGAAGAKDARARATAAATEALYMLGAMKVLLPELAEPACGACADACAGLLDLDEPLLTQHATEALLALANSPTMDADDGSEGVSADTIVGLMAPIAAVANANLNTAPTMVISLARLLSRAQCKLHAIDAQASAKALPTTFHSLVKLFASPHEGVATEVAEALISLVRSCIDSGMVQEGIKAIASARAAGKSAPSKPTTLMSVASSIESAIGFRYRGAWAVSIPVATCAFMRLGPASGPILAGTLNALGEMGEHASELMCKQQLQDCITAAIQAIGPEQVLASLPLKLEEAIDAELANRQGDGDGMEVDEQDVMNAASQETGRLWLVPLLRSGLVGANMGFFADAILPQARALGARAEHARNSQSSYEAQRCGAAEHALWSLFPAFANWPSDASDAFPLIAKDLGNALSSRIDLQGPICEGLKRLIRQGRIGAGVYEVDDDDEAGDGASTIAAGEPNDDQMPATFTVDIAEAQLAAVSKYARNFLPILFNLFVSSPTSRRGELSHTIGAFAKVTDQAQLGGFFRTVLRKLVKVTADDPGAPDALVEGGDDKTARRCTFMDLVFALVSGLDDQGLEMVYKIAKPACLEKESVIQKRAYKLLNELCEAQDGKWLEPRAAEIEELLVSGVDCCLPSARRYRLKVIGKILPALQERDAAADAEEGGDGAGSIAETGSLTVLLSELILATKETNARTRTLAYQLLISIPRSIERKNAEAARGVARSGNAGVAAWLGAATEEEDDEAMETEQMGVGVRRFFLTVLAGIVGSSPQMQSATIMALARLLYEFSSALVSTVPELLPAVCALLEGKSREVVKSCLGFVKVVVVRLPQQDLAAELPRLVPALLHWSEDSKNRFKLKVRVVLERMCKRCGYEVVEASMPKEHMALIAHIKREETRLEKKKKSSVAGSEHGAKSTRTARRSEWRDGDIFSDDEGDDSDDGRSRRSGRGGRDGGSFAPASRRGGGEGPRSAAAAAAKRATGGARLPASGDAPLDLLDDSAMRRSMLPQGERRRVKFEDDDDDSGYRTGADGKLMIVEESEGAKRRREEEEDNASEGGRSRYTSKTGKSRGAATARTNATGKSSRTVGTHNSNGVKRQRTTHERHSADLYKAKGKTTGDVYSKQTKLEPYAYWPLDPKLLNRRNSKKVAARAQLGGVVKSAKAAGILRGKKSKREV